MRVGVGYSENPNTALAAEEAVKEALAQSARLHGEELYGPCSLVLMFSTAQHDAKLLHASVSAKAGERLGLSPTPASAMAEIRSLWP